MKPAEIWRSLARAEALGGHSRWRQVAEIALLRLSDGKLQPDEYFNYRLFRTELPFSEKRKFLGYWMWDAVYALNHPEHVALADSKLRAYELFEREGLPHPRLRAVVDAAPRYPGCAALKTVADVASFLRSASYPLFVKPDDASHGHGAKLINRLERDMLHIGDGSTQSVDALAEEVAGSSRRTVLVQDAILPHPAIARMTGGVAATARLFVLRSNGEAVLHRAVLRIPNGRSMVDNFYAGRTGNLIAEIDIASGTCGAALTGFGFAHKQVDHHPGTGELVNGLEVPHWSEACELVRRATALLPGLPVQAWDVAFTPDGPSLIEVNARGEFRILQHATQRGLIDEHFRRVVKL